ncbi:hypothetical protein FRC11_007347 [Ceratobasidium sp. 423]|nr:hypothetical protein FRC11_007347 [Ceratobasidium sp. 423]
MSGLLIIGNNRPVEEDHWRYREVAIHDTHPLLSYFPEPPSKWLFWKTSPWSAKVHTAKDGTTISWHEVESHDEEDRDQWGVSTKIQAGAVAIYGAPSAYIEKRDNLGPVCVQLDVGPCEILDLKTIYLNQGEFVQREPVLLWRNDGLDPSRETRVSIRLVKSPAGTEIFFPFKSINFFEGQDPGPLGGNPKNVTFASSPREVGYYPGSHCEDFPKCTSRIDPWDLKTIGPSGSKLTYLTTISKYRVKEDPYVTLTVSGATAVYLYGAPDAYAIRPFAPQHICINDACRVIDVKQAYLHPPWSDMESTNIDEAQGQNATTDDITGFSSILHPELEPVLIWSINGLNYGIEHTLRLALASLPSPDTAEMSFVKFVVTKVSTGRGEYPPDPPASKPDRAYAGPLYPPHATKWAPLDHKTPPPISIETPSSSPELSSPVSCAITVLVAYICLRLVFGCCSCETREAQPLLPGPPPLRPPRNPGASDRPPAYNSIMPNRPNGRR